MLLDRGANVDINNGYHAPLHFAAQKGWMDVAVTLLDILDQSNDTPLFRAADKGHVDMINLLLDRGANIEAVNEVFVTEVFL